MNRLHIFPMLNVLLVAFLFSCNKDSHDEYGLPEPTQVGKGTFACLLNGERWEPCVEECSFCPPDPKILAYHYDYRMPYIEAQQNCNGIHQYIKILIDSVDVNNNIIGGYGVIFGNLNVNCDDYMIDTAGNHSIMITRYDATPTGVFSGLFEFTLINKCGPKDTIRITKGRFDVTTNY